MKALHYLNKQIAYIMLFLSSQSGSGFTLLVVFGFDLATNALGIQLFFSERLAESMAGLGVSKWSSFFLSVAFSAFASGALGLSIMQATLNNVKKSGLVLSVLSVIISVAGLAHVGIEAKTVEDLYNFNNAVRLAMILGLGLTPPIVYAMNAKLVLDIFGTTLARFNEASIIELEKSFKAQTAELGKLDEERTKADVNKQRSKINRQSRKSGNFRQEQKGSKSTADIARELGINL